LFEEHPGEIAEWAVNQMNWSDVQAWAKRAPDRKWPPMNWEFGWMNGEKEIVAYEGDPR
jgi:hypothetical protein